MKKNIAIRIMVVAVMIGLAGLVMSSSTWAGISGTDHDFSSRGWNSSGELCNVCHTPHDANADRLVPLWNHKTTTETFTLYDSSVSSTFDATVASLSGISKACLSCHDGTTAVDAFGNPPAAGTETISGDAAIGTDLRNNHPISFTYDADLAGTDGGLATPDSTDSVDAAGVVPLFSSKMECSSCHDVHDNSNDPFLVMGNNSSALCLTCHNK